MKKRYIISDASKEVEAWVYRLHCRLLEDDDLDLCDFAWLYGPFVAFTIIFAIVWFSVHGVGVDNN